MHYVNPRSCSKLESGPVKNVMDSFGRVVSVTTGSPKTTIGMLVHCVYPVSVALEILICVSDSSWLDVILSVSVVQMIGLACPPSHRLTSQLYDREPSTSRIRV